MRYIKEKGKRYIALLMVCIMMIGLFPLAGYAEPYPTSLVNGGFEYPILSATPGSILMGSSIVDQWWTNYNPTLGQQAQFGWNTTASSTPKFEFGGDWNVNGWGIKFIPEGRQFVELNPTEQAAIYQDLSTIPGQIFYWSLYQGGVWYSNSQNIDNTMAVRIGTPSELSTKATMISLVSTSFDQSWTSRAIYDFNAMTVIPTPSTYEGKDSNKSRLYTEPKRWTKYEGIYVVPEGQTVTRFVFASLSAIPTQGNLLDGVVFRLGTTSEVDTQTVSVAKSAAENSSYLNMTQQMATGENVIKTELKLRAEAAIDDSSVTTTINKVDYIQPTAGSPENINGTNGSYAFTVTVSKGDQNQTTEQKTITITATAYTGISDVDAVAAAKAAIVTALSSLAVSNATTENDLLSAAQGATLHYVVVAWNGTNGFDKTNATSSVTGSITGTLNLTLNGASDNVAVSKTIAQLPATGGGNTGEDSTPSTPSTPQSLANTIVNVNGVPVSAGTETRTTEGGKTTTLVQVNNAVIQSKIDEAISKNSNNASNLIQVQVSDMNAVNSSVELTGDIVKKLEENAFNVSVKNNDIEYIIPAKEFLISKVAETLNISEADLKAITVEVRITKPDEKAVETYTEVTKANGAELIFPPVTFELVAKTTQTDGTTGEVKISKFSNYVERVMEIPAGVDKSKITTGIVFNSDDTYSHVPTSVYQKDGKWYASINSLTNSTYSVIWNPITVKSVENHWSKDMVNDMASRLVIKNPETFMPDQKITRGEFAEYMTKAIGIFRLGAVNTQKFTDVEVKHDLAYAIEIASEYGIISGYPDGSFKPDARISREEAMAMYSKAMTLVGLEEVDNGKIKNYTDEDLVARWAYDAVKKTVSAGVFNGKTSQTINPKDTFTCAEAVTAIRNLLVAKGLINE